MSPRPRRRLGRGALLALLALAVVFLTVGRSAPRLVSTWWRGEARAAEPPRSPQSLALERIGKRLTVPTFRAGRAARPVALQAFVDENPRLSMALTEVVKASFDHDAEKANICAWELMNRSDKLKKVGFGGTIAVTLAVSGEKARVVRMEGMEGSGADGTFVDCYAGAVGWASTEWDAPQTPDGETTIVWPYTFGPAEE